MNSGSERACRASVERTKRIGPAFRAHRKPRFRKGIKRRFTDAMLGVRLEAAVAHNALTSVNVEPSGFSTTQGIRLSNRIAPTSEILSGGTTVMHPSISSRDNSSPISRYEFRKPYWVQNFCAR